MIKNVLILCAFCIFLSGAAFCQEEIEINSKVMSVNPDKDYLIIRVGETNGVEMGDGLIVHRDGEKLGEAQIIEVRPEVSAAEILNAEKEIKEGDDILIVKKIKKSKAAGKEKVYTEQKKSKWATLLGSSAETSSAAPVQTVTSGSAARPGTIRSSGDIRISQSGSVIKTDIDTAPGTVFSYAMMVLREEGYIVTFSSRVTGVILAEKPIELTLMKELWADATARIEHKLVASIEIKNAGGSSELNVSGFREHTQKNRQVKLPVAGESKYYRDLVDLASKIKERAGF